MAGIGVSEFSVFGVDPNTGQAVAKVPPITEQVIAAAPGNTAAFNAATKFVRVHNGTAAGVSVAFGVGVTVATTTNMRLAANQTEYFMTNAGDQMAVVANA